jgi:hypothetical protein
MKIELHSDDIELMRGTAAQIGQDLEQAGLSRELRAGALEIRPPSGHLKGGELVSLATIALTAVGAGGALTVALSREGFLTRLVRVLEKVVERRIQVTVEDDRGNKLRLSGPAGQIRKLLSELKK